LCISAQSSMPPTGRWGTISHLQQRGFDWKRTVAAVKRVYSFEPAQKTQCHRLCEVDCSSPSSPSQLAENTVLSPVPSSRLETRASRRLQMGSDDPSKWDSTSTANHKQRSDPIKRSEPNEYARRCKAAVDTVMKSRVLVLLCVSTGGMLNSEGD